MVILWKACDPHRSSHHQSWEWCAPLQPCVLSPPQANMQTVFQLCLIIIPMMFSLSMFNVITDSMLTKSVPSSDTGKAILFLYSQSESHQKKQNMSGNLGSCAQAPCWVCVLLSSRCCALSDRQLGASCMWTSAFPPSEPFSLWWMSLCSPTCCGVTSKTKTSKRNDIRPMVPVLSRGWRTCKSPLCCRNSNDLEVQDWAPAGRTSCCIRCHFWDPGFPHTCPSLQPRCWNTEQISITTWTMNLYFCTLIIKTTVNFMCLFRVKCDRIIKPNVIHLNRDAWSLSKIL